MSHSPLVIIRGGGDLATGVIQKFYRAGMRVLVLETEAPTAIRRTVSLCEAMYTGKAQVEDLLCRRIHSLAEIDACYRANSIPLLADPEAASITTLRPLCVVDAILAKRNLGLHRGMAPLTIALGPGFTAGQDADAVIETKRGHNLGRLILQGTALPNTGIPGEIGGQSALRVLHAPHAGILRPLCQIGDIVQQGQSVLAIDAPPIPGSPSAADLATGCVIAPFTGLLRGLLREGLNVHQGMKIADIDPRTNVNYHIISDKARCIGGGALEAFFYLCHQKGLTP